MRAQDFLPDEVDAVKVDGLSVRKGSIGAFLRNAVAFADPAVTGAARAAVLRDIEDGLPGLRALGLFDILEIRDPALRAFVEARLS